MAGATRNAGFATTFGERVIRHADWVMGVAVLGLMVTLITPIPPQMLDVLLTFNITFSLLMLLVTLNVRNTAELSTFPTILLFGTLFRLGLNVASTRLILSGGEAGAIITAFGRFVVGSNLAVGLIVFLILVVIQFVVITKGAGRISEVSARFVLDAMPGKQMAIDADLNAGLIDSEEAKKRRASIASEAEFYGAMDGASKFVRGDAIAGLIITALNLLGGIAIGMAGSMTLAEAGQRYSLLTVGDGLVSQVPALLVSTAAAVLTTRASGKQSLGQNLIAQVGGRPKATIIAAAVLLVLGLLPGMPIVPFWGLGAALLVAWRFTRNAEGADDLLEGLEEKPAAAATPVADAEKRDTEADAEEVRQLLGVDRLALEIGYRLIPLVQDKSGTGILDHIAQLRKSIAAKHGLVLPAVRIKDNVRLEPSAYRVLVGGVEIARGNVEPNHWLAMDGGSAVGKIQGRETTDPAFGLPAWWVDESGRDEAEIMGYTVIDATSVLVTHLSETIKRSFGEVLTRDDVKELVENVERESPAVVKELVPERLSYGEIQHVLRNLLREEVPIRNMPLILEALADNVSKTKDPEQLTELVRQRLGRTLCELYADKSGVIHAVTLDPTLESRIAASVDPKDRSESRPVDPAYLQRLVERIESKLSGAAKSGRDVVLLVRSNVRRLVGELVRASLPKVAVVSYNEVVPAKSIETVDIVRMEEA
ncbi:MAG: flagellar biosynthesis protein FlhA [Planctomycetota bacterium]